MMILESDREPDRLCSYRHIRRETEGTMKIIHCADLHLDSRMETNLSSENAQKRRYELLNTFEKMVDYAVENGVKAIIIAGDLFDTSTGMQKKIKSRVLEVIRSAGNIDFLYLRGNHDKDDALFCEDNRPLNLKTFSNKWTTYRYDDVTISGIEPDMSSDYNISLKPEDINIVVMHGIVAGVSSKDDAYQIPVAELRNKNIDYLALGHIHEYRSEKLDERGVMCYSGCLEGRGFDECGRKGFVVIDTDEGTLEYNFVPFSQRTCEMVEADITQAQSEADILSVIDEKLESISDKSLVKLVLTGEVKEELDIDTDYILNRYKDRFFFIKVVNKTQIKIDYDSYRNDISLKGEFIRQVEMLDIPQDDKAQIIVTGIKVLMGREL